MRAEERKKKREEEKKKKEEDQKIREAKEVRKGEGREIIPGLYHNKLGIA